MNAAPFSIGSDVWPGLTKLAEEAAEVIQIIAKLQATGGEPIHYDGSDLRVRLADELGDLQAAIGYVMTHNAGRHARLGRRLSGGRYRQRRDTKRDLFDKWHKEQR